MEKENIKGQNIVSSNKYACPVCKEHLGEIDYRNESKICPCCQTKLYMDSGGFNIHIFNRFMIYIFTLLGVLAVINGFNFYIFVIMAALFIIDFIFRTFINNLIVYKKLGNFDKSNYLYYSEDVNNKIKNENNVLGKIIFNQNFGILQISIFIIFTIFIFFIGLKLGISNDIPINKFYVDKTSKLLNTDELLDKIILNKNNLIKVDQTEDIKVGELVFIEKNKDNTYSLMKIKSQNYLTTKEKITKSDIVNKEYYSISLIEHKRTIGIDDDDFFIVVYNKNNFDIIGNTMRRTNITQKIKLFKLHRDKYINLSEDKLKENTLYLITSNYESKIPSFIDFLFKDDTIFITEVK
jgi:hypothetical protein